MRIILFTENQRFGGMDTFIVNLAKYWPDKDDELFVICNDNHPGADYLSENLPPTVTLTKHHIPLNWHIFSRYIRYLPSLIQKILRKMFRYSLIPYQLYAISSILKKHKGDALLTVNGSYPGGETCRIANIVWRGISDGVSIHNFHNYAETERGILSPIERLIDQKLRKVTNHLVSVSNYCSSTITSRGTFKDLKSIKTIPNGIELENSKDGVNLRDAYGISKSKNILLMVSTFEERKGHEFALNALKIALSQRDDLHLLLVGTATNNEIGRVQRLIDERGLKNDVTITGRIDNIANSMSAANLIIIPSQDYESFALTAVEAMLNELPIVATNIGGIPETIGQDGHCGFLVDPGEPDKFSEKILYIVDNPEFSKKMGANGLSRALDVFDPKKMAREYHKLTRTKS